MNSPLISIGMSVYNVEHFVKEAIHSVYEQSYSNWELIVIDDASHDRTHHVVESCIDKRVRVFRNTINVGCYWNRNRAMLLAKGSYFTTLDGDDCLHPDKLLKQIEAINGIHYGCLCGYRCSHTGKVNKSGHNTFLFNLALIEKIGFYDSVRFDADSEYIHRMSRSHSITTVPEPLLNYRYRHNSLARSADTGTEKGTDGSRVRELYSSNYKQWHERSKSLRLPFWQVRRRFPPGDAKQLCTREPVTASLATLPERLLSLRNTLNSILAWADRVNLFVNGLYTDMPDFLRDSRISVHINGHNIGDRGKFFCVQSVNKGYHFICDDDLVYSEEYVECMIEKIELYEQNVIVGVHGSILSRDYTDYYSSDRTIYSMRSPKSEDHKVHFLGTGAIAFHAGNVKLSYDIFVRPNMADVLLGVYARKRNIPLICIKSPKGLVTRVEQPQTRSIYSHSLGDIQGSEFNSRSDVNKYLAANWE